MTPNSLSTADRLRQTISASRTSTKDIEHKLPLKNGKDGEDNSVTENLSQATDAKHDSHSVLPSKDVRDEKKNISPAKLPQTSLPPVPAKSERTEGKTGQAIRPSELDEREREQKFQRKKDKIARRKARKAVEKTENVEEIEEEIYRTAHDVNN